MGAQVRSGWVPTDRYRAHAMTNFCVACEFVCLVGRMREQLLQVVLLHSVGRLGTHTYHPRQNLAPFPHETICVGLPGGGVEPSVVLGSRMNLEQQCAR